MHPPDDLTAALPAPRDDEPAALRRDIVDEITDHLTCATRREQLSGRVDETEAQRRATDRFGDPVRLARKLWFDALWEQIMSQRILVAVCVAMVLVCCAALGMMWLGFDRQEQMLEAWQKSSENQMREHRELMERLIDSSQKNQPPSEWNPVQFQLVTGRVDGPPAAGVAVTMSLTQNDSGVPTYQADSDADGRVRFGKVRYGNYQLSLRFKDNTFGHTTFSILPDDPIDKIIVVPSRDKPRNVAIDVNWPEDIASHSPQIVLDTEYLRLKLPHQGFRDEFDWRKHPGPTARSIWLDTQGRFHARNQSFFKDDIQSKADVSEDVSTLTLKGGYTSVQQFDWPGREYVARYLWVVFPLNEATPKPVDGEKAAAIWFESSDWKHHFDDEADPVRLTLTPTDDAKAKIRAGLKALDAFQARTPSAGDATAGASGEESQKNPEGASSTTQN